MRDSIRKTGIVALAATLAATVTPGAVRAQSASQNPVATVKIGVIDSDVSRNALRKIPNANVVSKVFHNGVRAGWTGATYYSHGDLVSISAATAARIAAPKAPITVFAGNVYMPGDTSSDRPDRITYRISYEATHKAIDWMKEQGCSVVIFTGTGKDTQAMRDIADHVQKAGMILVASTNNLDTGEKVYPAAYPDVIAVAGDDPKQPIHTDPQLASYVSFIGDGRAPVGDAGNEVGSSFAAGSIGGYAAARASTMQTPTLAAIKASMSEIASTVTYSGHSIPKLSSMNMGREKSMAASSPSKGPMEMASTTAMDMVAVVRAGSER